MIVLAARHQEESEKKSWWSGGNPVSNEPLLRESQTTYRAGRNTYWTADRQFRSRVGSRVDGEAVMGEGLQHLKDGSDVGGRDGTTERRGR